MEFQKIVSVTRDIFQIFFFATVVIISILTYIQAKRTLLQPIKTEVFKEQVKILSNVLSFFEGKNEVELREDMHFSKFMEANCVQLMDNYAVYSFAIEIDTETRPYNTIKCPVLMVSPDALMIDNGYTIEDSERSENQKLEWDKYKFDVISVPAEMINKKRELRNMIESPLLDSQKFYLDPGLDLGRQG